MLRPTHVLLLATTLTACGGGSGGVAPALPPASQLPLAAAEPPPEADDGSWRRLDTNPLLVPGPDPAPATTYATALADPTVRWDAALGRWRAWFSTTVKDRARPDAAGRMRILHAESADGVRWTLQAEPAFAAADDPAAWDHTHAETPCVLTNPDPTAPPERRWLLFYAGGNLDADIAAGRSTVGSYPFYQIGLAWSADGRRFTRAEVVGGQPGLVLGASQVLGTVAGFADGLVADPEAVVVDGAIRLWCSSMAVATDRSPLAFGISHARSADGTAWSCPVANPLPSLRRAGEVAGGEQPAVIYDPASLRYEMWFRNDSAADKARLPTAWFSTAGFWRAISADGVEWTPDYRARDVTWDAQRAYEAYGLLTGCAVVRRDGVDRLFYCAWSSAGVPDQALYRLPLQDGRVVPAVTAFASASRRAPLRSLARLTP